jgi:hypothetical protein
MHSLDLFSGLGGNAYAFRSFATPALYCEVDRRAQTVLRAAIAGGFIPEAPIHGDVQTLTTTPLYAEAKLRRPLLVSGSWPCQGNSVLGKRQGMDDARSGLLRSLCDVVLDAKPEVFFAENVPAAATNGSYDYLLQALEKDYEVSCTYVRAGELGFPHERKRFFCVGVLRGGAGAAALADVRFEPITKLLLARDEPARVSRLRPLGLDERLHALGNAVVPAASYYAFLALVDRPVEGLPDSFPPLALVMDPAAYTPPPTVTVDPARQTAEVLQEPWRTQRWSTPRAGARSACHRLTTRSLRDLATQVRFERGTPDEGRGWHLDPEWVGWMMGYPPQYTRRSAV